MLLNAPAKINLTLRILSRRADGYHEISSMMRAVRLFDEVDIAMFGFPPRPLAQAGGLSARAASYTPDIAVRTDMPGVPEGPENLAYRAAGLAFETWFGAGSEAGSVAGAGIGSGIGTGSEAGSVADPAAGRESNPQLIITLKKRIPMAAGLGGGSSDAAAVLLALAKEWKPEAVIAEIAALGAVIGADIPFCVYACAAANPGLGFEGAGAALAEGVGERIMPVQSPERACVVLVKPPLGTRAGEIYSLYEAMREPAREPVREPVNEACAPAASDNDLEAPCVRAWPLVAETIVGLRRICAEEGADNAKVQLSGSGPTVFAYFESGCFKGGSGVMASAARRVHERARAAFPDMFVCLTETL